MSKPIADTKWTESDCAIKSDSKDIEIKGKFPETTYSFAHGICIDLRCFKLDSKIDETFKETIHDSMACFSKLVPQPKQTVLEKIRREESLNSTELEDVRGSSPLRNIAQLLQLNKLGPGFADIFNEREQVWVAIDSKTNTVKNESCEGVRSSLRKPSPLRLSCFPLDTKFSYERARISQPTEVVPTLSTAAEASMPGMPSWPSIELHPLGYALQKKSRENVKSILVHEVMHLLGYTHGSSTLPLFSACQVCCFQSGLRQDHGSNRASCEDKGPESIHALACSICAGEKTVTEFQGLKAAYAKNLKACYKITNPL